MTTKRSRRSDPDSGWLARAGGLVGAVFLLFSQTFWNNAIEAEVYGVSAFMLSVLAWLAVRWYDHRTQPASNHLLLLMIYLLGLGVGFHLGSILIYPGVFLLVLLARDRLGIKPFYYTWKNGVFCMASEIKALLTVIKCRIPI